MKRVYLFFFVGIFIAGAFLRLYKLDKIPPSLNWDEVAAAYNAYTIKKWSKDEWGKTLPVVFTSFRDDKRPVHIYFTSIIFDFFGVSDFTARFSSALVGIFMIPLFLLFGKLYFGSNLAGLLSAFAIAFSTYEIHYSRGLWEAHFALFFLVLGLVLFKASLSKKGKKIFLPFSYFSFGLSLLSYHSALVVVPPLVFLLTLFFIRSLNRMTRWFALSFFIFLVFIGLLFFEPRLLGIARINQNKLAEEIIAKTYLFQKTHNLFLGQLEYRAKDYKNYFSYQYLFIYGSKSPRASMGYGGLFARTIFFLAFFGSIFLLLQKRFSELLLILIWFLLAPLPAVFAGGEPNATRAIFMLGPPEILAGFGLYSIVSLSKKLYIRVFLIFLSASLILIEVLPQIDSYFKKYAIDQAIEWQYGMREIVEFTNENPHYKKVYMDIVRQQPYIFFLWYGKISLPEFLASVKYDMSEAKSYNTVLSFGKYQFGGWNWVESYPAYNYLYVLEPYKYSGLRMRNNFEVVKLIKYPNQADAFYLVSGYW